VDRLCERRIGGASGGSRCEWQIWGASGGSGVRVADLGYERWIGCASGGSKAMAPRLQLPDNFRVRTFGSSRNNNGIGRYLMPPA
jgi:hypothetical protein